MLHLLFLFLIKLSVASYFTVPVGYDEAFLGNAGVAASGTPGNVLYNPAGMAFLANAASVSLSGTSIAYQELDGSEFNRTTGTLKTSGFLTTVIFPVTEEINMAAFWVYPGNTDDSFRIEERSTTNRNVSENLVRTAAIGGLAYSKYLNAEWSAGFSIGVGWSEIDRRRNEVTWDGTTSRLESLSQIESRYDILLNPGMLWRAFEVYQTGVSLSWKALSLFNEGETYTAIQETNQTTPNEATDLYTPRSHEFLSATWGHQLLLHQHLLFADLTYATHSPFESSFTVTTKPYWALSLGWKTPRVDRFRYLSGLQVAQCDSMQSFLASFGLGFTQGKLEGNLGAFAHVTENRTNENVRSDIIGFLYSSSFDYK
jgi:hypothetical protein